MSATPTAKIRVMLVDDSEVVRMGLRTLLEDEPTLSLVGEAANVADAIETCARVRPDVVLLDVRLPDGTGIDACRGILHRRPGTRVLMLTSVDTGPLVAEAIRAGAHGYLLKEVNGRALIQAVHEVAAGGSVLDPAVTGGVMQQLKEEPATTPNNALATLSPQERRVLALIAEGRTNKEAGVALNLSEKTVKNYLNNIFDKLHVTRRAQAAALYVRHAHPPH